MMAGHDEEAAIVRVATLARARRLCSAWAYWCLRTNIRTGYERTMDTGGIERCYKRPWQWDTPEPQMPEADEITGMKVQRAFIQLPEIYRNILRTQFCVRPWVVGLKERELESALARKARVSVGAYVITLERALLALANVMKRKGVWEP